MKDIETGESIFQENYVRIINFQLFKLKGLERDRFNFSRQIGLDEEYKKAESVDMNHPTFVEQINLNREYCENYSDNASREKFEIDHFFCTYEICDQEVNVLTDEKSGGLHQYPFYIPLSGEGFKKTLEYFATKERISIN